MPDSDNRNLQADAANTLIQVMTGIRTRLHEATVNAPPQVYQAIEELKARVQSRLEHTEQQLSEIAHELGETEEDILEWLKLDIRSIENRFLQSLLNTTDSSRVEIQRWLNKNRNQED